MGRTPPPAAVRFKKPAKSSPYKEAPALPDPSNNAAAIEEGEALSQATSEKRAQPSQLSPSQLEFARSASIQERADRMEAEEVAADAEAELRAVLVTVLHSSRAHPALCSFITFYTSHPDRSPSLAAVRERGPLSGGGEGAVGPQSDGEDGVQRSQEQTVDLS